MSNTMSPLRGYRILEVSSRPSGAYCGRLLALLGAEVFRAGLPIAADCGADLLADYEGVLSVGKRTLSTDSPELDELARTCDLLIVDSVYDDADDGAARALTQRLLAFADGRCPVVDVAGHRARSRAGKDERSTSPATALTESAQGGMSWALGHPGQEPLTLPADVPDYLCGAEAAGVASLALLVAFADSAAKQRWEVAAADAVAYYVGQICANFIPYERPWHRDGARASMSGGSYPAAMFECNDGHVSIMCRTRREWHALLRAMGTPQWSRQEQFQDARVVARYHADEADSYVTAWTRSHTCDELFALGNEFSFPVAPVLTIAESIKLEQFAERKFITRSPEVGGLLVSNAPWQLCGVTEPGRRTSSWPAAHFSPRKPLDGLRVLDLSWVWSGPMVTAALGDLGAEIIKIENRKRADPARLRGRAIRNGQQVEGPELEVTPYFNQMNRGKQSVALDIATDQGRELILELVEQCDVVVENMRPGALERRGLDYSQLSGRNPSVVMLSMSIMGQTGPMRGVGGYAPVMSGLAGLDSLVGYSPDDLIGLYNPALGDPNGAAHAMAVLMAALVQRERTGQGAWIDLAQVECLINILPAAVVEAQRHGANVVRGNKHARWWPHGTFRAGGNDDDWVSVAVRTDQERGRLAGLLGIPVGSTPDAYGSALGQWTAQRPSAEAARDLSDIGVPAASVQTFEQMLASDWARDRDLFQVTAHPYLGEQPIFSLPWKCNGDGFPAQQCSPLLGADTDAVLGRLLKLDRARLSELRAAGVIE